MNRVSFIHTSPISLSCRETGDRFTVALECGAYAVACNGKHIGCRVYRDSALQLAEQYAALRFLVAQSDSAFA